MFIWPRKLSFYLYFWSYKSVESGMGQQKLLTVILEKPYQIKCLRYKMTVLIWFFSFWKYVDYWYSQSVSTPTENVICLGSGSPGTLEVRPYVDSFKHSDWLKMTVPISRVSVYMNVLVPVVILCPFPSKHFLRHFQDIFC